MKKLLRLLAVVALLGVACGGADAAVSSGQPDPAASEPEPEADLVQAEDDDEAEPMDVAAEPMDDAAEPMDDAAEPMDDEAEPMDDEAEPMDDPADGFPVTILAGNGEVTIEQRPERIVSLSTVATETLFAIGAGDQVLAVDDQSNFPPEAPVSDLSGFAPNVEAIAELEPDLVILSFDPGDIVAGLDALGIPTVLEGTALSLDDAYAQIERAGAVTGHVAESAAVVADMQQRIDAAVASAPSFDVAPRIFHEVSFDLYSSTSSTFIGQLYARFGLENIADAADAQGFGFPQLAAEYVLEQNPDIIFLGDVLYGESAETVAARPGWDALAAVATGSIVELDTDIASRWGPRIPDLMEQIAAALVEHAGVAA
jgi:iron complex transport system substrate-binding protein